jgi:hypothetical protein
MTIQHYHSLNQQRYSPMVDLSPYRYYFAQSERYATGSSSSSRHQGTENHPLPPAPLDDLDPSERKEYDNFDLNDTLMEDGIGDDALFTFDEDSPSRDFRARSSTPDPIEQATAAAAAAIAGSAPPSESSSSSRKRPASSSHPVRRSSPPTHSYLHLYEGSDSTRRSGHPTSSSTSRNSATGGRYAHPYHYSAGGAPTSSHGGTRTPIRGTPSRPFYPGYSPYNRFQVDSSPWEGSMNGRSSPPPHGMPSGAPYDSDEDSIPQLPSSSTKKRPLSPHHGQSTPDRLALDMSRSPFRSPLYMDGSAGKSNKHFRGSPFFQPSPPHIGTLGSFGMETPGGTLANASLPSFELDEETVPFPLGGEGFQGGHLNISRSHSHDSESSPLYGVERGRHAPERSPLPEYMNDLSPIEAPMIHDGGRSPSHHHPRNPLSSASGRYPSDTLGASSSAGTVGTRPKGPGAVTMSGGRAEGPSSRLAAGATPKQLWPPSAESASKTSKSTASTAPGHFRLEIGGGNSSLSKTLQGINSIMQHPRQAPRDNAHLEGGGAAYRRTPTNHPAPPPPYHHSSQLPHQGEKATPIKSFHSRQLPPGHHPYPHQLSGNKPMYPQLSMKSGYSDGRGPPKPQYMGHPIGDGTPSSSHGGVPPPGGKENRNKKAPVKRSLCNCKKSRCLKLYCECFAAELFCQGCNCTDCHNTPEAGIEREKAIKDTRAKNSKAFQTRFGVKEEAELQGTTPQRIHNMGCKCKKSECLKKYCEVRRFWILNCNQKS